MSGICIVAACDAEIGPGRRMCERHWYQLPGRMRSKLSLAQRMRRSAIVEEMWDKGRLEIERG